MTRSVEARLFISLLQESAERQIKAISGKFRVQPASILPRRRNSRRPPPSSKSGLEISGLLKSKCPHMAGKSFLTGSKLLSQHSRRKHSGQCRTRLAAAQGCRPLSKELRSWLLTTCIPKAIYVGLLGYFVRFLESRGGSYIIAESAWYPAVRAGRCDKLQGLPQRARAVSGTVPAMPWDIPRAAASAGSRPRAAFFRIRDIFPAQRMKRSAPKVSSLNFIRSAKPSAS
ncbi:hypothetical protein J2W42_000763 [Rhizobium tibeticum]|nr:hypothetical protein [Rhizobium tibeticum]